MPDSKKSMLTARIQKRLRLLKLTSFTEYVNIVLDPNDPHQELTNFIDMVTTNKTDFFREPAHFDFMTKQALPDLMQRMGAGTQRPLFLWSAPCSTGEEPYTMAMVIKEFAKKFQPNFRAQILGSDLSSKALRAAKNGVYQLEKASPVPMELKKKYMLRGKDRTDKRVKMSSEIRSMLALKHLNFMDNDYGVNQTMDIIFCRNCLIYFDRPTAESIVNKLCRHLAPGGYFFVGHSETLNQLSVPLEQTAPTIYQKV